MAASKVPALLCTALLLAACASSGVDFDKLNAQAAAEYLQPVRPGGLPVPGSDGAVTPFWNVFSPKFTYAPAFDFAPVDGAVSYRFDFWFLDLPFTNEDLLPVPEERPFAGDKLAEYLASGKPVVASFTASSPQACIAPVWNELPIGSIGLVVTGVDQEGSDAGFAGCREFVRDFPFQGPYDPAPRSYFKAAAMGLEYANDYEPIVDGIRRMGEDLQMPEDVLNHYYDSYNTEYTPGGSLYASKFVSATIHTELALARMSQCGGDWYIDVAKKAAAFLMSIAEPEGAPLAHFTPTYYRHDSKIDLLMAMDPVMAVDAYLDLFDATADPIYYNEAMAVLSTYDRIIDENGYVPKKLVLTTGEATVPAGALPAGLMVTLARIEKNYGEVRFTPLRQRCEKYFNEVLLPDFDMSGQYEDVTVDLRQYQDLAMSWAVRFAQYLVEKDSMTAADLQNARDLARFVEDQFIHWQLLSNGKQVPEFMTPGVYEQYYCEICIDASAAMTAQMFLSLYDATGEELYFQKAKALVDAIVKAQNPHTGEIPTFWSRWYSSGGGFWLNCTEHSAQVLLRMEDYN